VAARAQVGRLRADAHRNREALLAAARDAVIEHGADVPLDDIAKRAGVGIATLYRRFGDRGGLLRQLAIDLMGHSAAEATSALAEEADPFDALARYMHRALDLRISAAMPALVTQVDMDAELLAARAASVGAMERIVELAKAAGSLRPDVSAGDVGLLLVRLARPLPGPFPAGLHDELAHRHLDLLLDGLRRVPEPGALPGPALTLGDLATMPPGPRAGKEEQA
jgi:AcrR family transcriptional regulator